MKRSLIWFALLFGSAAVAQPVVDVTEVGFGFSGGIGGTSAGDGSNRLFVVEQAGRIRVWEGSGSVRATPFLDIDALTNGGGEQGLLGLAFHPDYASNGLFYVNYTNLAGDTVIARYAVSADPNVADPASATPVLSFVQEAGNHNGGDMHFGADGFLYISSGDGGFDWGNSQNPATLLGKILRIDVDGDDFPGDPDRNYAIPAGNPLVGVPGAAEEIWLMGLRNPWRFGFDRSNGDMFIGDVGEGASEEINFQSGASLGGENYGWPCYEGQDPFQTAGCGSIENYTFPILELLHGAPPNNNCSIIAGFRYRGSAFPTLSGWFFYTDWCTGLLWAARPTTRNPEGAGWEAFLVNDELGGFSYTGFAEDDAGEIYLIGRENILQIEGLPDVLFMNGFD